LIVWGHTAVALRDLTPERGRAMNSRHHFTARIVLSYDPNKPLKQRAEERRVRNANYRKLREMGWEHAYFPFRRGGEAGKERARKAAEAHAREWEEKSG